MCRGSSPPAAALTAAIPAIQIIREIPGILRDPPWPEQPRSQRSDGLGGDAAAQGQAEVSDGQDDFGTGHGGHLHQF